MVMNCPLFHLITHTPKNSTHIDEDGINFNTKKMVYNNFQMPLNYPRYNKEDYEKMEEYKVDFLLNQYGLDTYVNGTLEEKRKFAMETFLWPHQH
ncbi:hypothetical protein RND81_04G172500 [Saponaria officinalis]|uniref:DUF7722 domain-containing protein n=1 Tax=Saponaria officinalis TaxID=3572 RepID=A0AAW1LLS8_SAPOF